MKRYFLLGALAVLCGCRHIDRTPIVPMADSGPPMPDSSGETAPVIKATPPPPNPPPPTDADMAPAGGTGDYTAGTPWRSMSEAINSVNGQLEDVYFAYDQFELSSQAAASLRRDADLMRQILRAFPQLQVTVEGHCDERGSAEYNLGLGDRRARRTISSLAELGLPAGNFKPLSYGKEAPQCTESNESCWSRNRRAHFVVRTAATE